jgi:type IV pilus assembly protein PilV
MTQAKINHPVGAQRGFSLVEVLIALIIMSVGMLGIASLYVQGMQAGRTSLFRHNAITLAGDVADRIRANRTAGITYETRPGADNNCIAGGIDCTADEMAEQDVFVWLQQADDTLPNGDVVVDFDDTVTPPEYEITVTWNDPGPGPNPTYAVRIPVMGP